MDGKQMGDTQVDEEQMKEVLENVKIGSKLEARWTDIQNKTEETILGEQVNKKIREVEAKANLELLELCKTEIEAEKEKFK